MELLVPLLIEMIVGFFDSKTMENSQNTVSNLLSISLPHSHTCECHFDETSSRDHFIALTLLSEIAILPSYGPSQLSYRIPELAGTGVVSSLPI